MSNNDQPISATDDASRPRPDQTRRKVLPFARPAPRGHKNGHAGDRPEPPSAA